MKPLHYEAICKMLLERFGEPIGDREAAPTSKKKKDMGNRGFGAKLDEGGCCSQCGMMPGLGQGHSCGGMDEVDEVDAFNGPSERDKFWAMADELISQYGDPDMGAEEYMELLLQNDIPKDVALDMVEDITGERLEETDVDQKAPPGGEKVVKALKKDKNVDNPWAVAWAMKNRGEI